MPTAVAPRSRKTHINAIDDRTLLPIDATPGAGGIDSATRLGVERVGPPQTQGLAVGSLRDGFVCCARQSVGVADSSRYASAVVHRSTLLGSGE